MTAAARAERQRLRDAVDGHITAHGEDLDEPARVLLRRLADDPDAAALCSRMNLEEDSFLTLCIWFEQTARTYPDRVTALPEERARLERAENAVAELRGFVSNLSRRPPAWDLLTPWMQPNLETIDAMQRSLSSIERAIFVQRRIVDDLLPQRLRITYKKHDKSAPINAAIFQAIEALRRGTGRPHEEDVAELARLVLGIELTVERVNHVSSPRARGHR